MQQQAAATSDIARNAHEAAQGTDEVAGRKAAMAIATQETGHVPTLALLGRDPTNSFGFIATFLEKPFNQISSNASL